jgi:hypothetical protein
MKSLLGFCLGKKSQNQVSIDLFAINEFTLLKFLAGLPCGKEFAE